MWPLVGFVVGVYTGKKCPYITDPIVEKSELVWHRVQKIWKNM